MVENVLAREMEGLEQAEHEWTVEAVEIGEQLGIIVIFIVIVSVVGVACRCWCGGLCVHFLELFAFVGYTKFLFDWREKNLAGF